MLIITLAIVRFYKRRARNCGPPDPTSSLLCSRATLGARRRISEPRRSRPDGVVWLGSARLRCEATSWYAAAAGWVGALLARDRGAALRADLDRLVTQAIIPERASRLQPLATQREE